MLTKLNNHTVQGDGFTVYVPDIHSVVYEEGGRIARIEIEGGMSAGNVDWLVYVGTLLEWNVEGQLEPMSMEDREAVLSRISGALEVLEMPHRIE